MIYLSQLLGNPVFDANGEKIGVVNDLGIATREVFPRVTSLAFRGPGKTPFMISWRKYVETFNEGEVRLAVPATEIRFSYLQPDEVLIARDLLNKQIVDTRGMRVVRVNDLKQSTTSSFPTRAPASCVCLAPRWAPAASCVPFRRPSRRSFCVRPAPWARTFQRRSSPGTTWTLSTETSPT